MIIHMAMGQNLWYHIWVVIHIHLPAILMFTRCQSFDPSPYESSPHSSPQRRPAPRVLVTGATGLLGRQMMRMLSSTSWEAWPSSTQALCLASENLQHWIP